MNFEGDGIKEYISLVTTFERGEYRPKPNKLELDIKQREYPAVKQSIEEAPKFELKALPPHLRHVFFDSDETSLVIIPSDFNLQQVVCLVDVLMKFKRDIGWFIVDIIRIPPDMCSQKIHLIPDHKQSNKH